jgi:hypothetical protein
LERRDHEIPEERSEDTADSDGFRRLRTGHPRPVAQAMEAQGAARGNQRSDTRPDEEVAKMDNEIAKALVNTFVSLNVEDSNLEPANLVDTTDRIAKAGNQIAEAIDGVARALRRIAESMEGR